VLGRDAAARDVLRAAVARSGYRQKRREYRGTDRGIGLSLFFHGAGFTGSGEVKLQSKASLELTAAGVRVLVASTEIGQGQRTAHAQIVADTLGLPYDSVEVAVADTARVPDSGHGRLAHDDGGGRAAEAVRGGDEAATGPTVTCGLSPRARPARRHEAV